jgi:hypothetical protein
MAIPELVPIAHKADYRTDTIGRYRDGQFIGGSSVGFPDEPFDGRHSGTRHLFTYVHLFDNAGNHERSEITRVATREEDTFTAEEIALCDQLTANLQAGLADAHFCDIAIRPFRVEHSGVVFGLIDETEMHEGLPWAELYPEGLGFSEPWNGLYDT